VGLYIQGIELPKEQNVPTWAVIFSNGEVRIYKDGFNTDQGNGKGTAIPVPPHGDLIDRTEAIVDANERAYDFWSSDAETDAAVKFLQEQVSIIPAEEA